VLFFRVAPLAAISSDLLTSLVMMPVGAAVHLRCRTVNWRLVRWLTVGSVPAAFAGAVIIGSIGHAPGVQADLKLVIGIALCASVGMTCCGRCSTAGVITTTGRRSCTRCAPSRSA
jgi:uncharacterized protein